MSPRTMLDRSFAIDRRALAAFRIAIALILLVDLFIRSGSIVEHYSDRGLLPRTQWVEHNQGTARWSLHVMNGEPAFQRVLFIGAAGAAGAMLVGFKTRWAVLLAWLLTHSLQMRNPMINNGGDVLLRAMLLWSIFLPLGDRWSIDARRATKRGARASSRRETSAESETSVVHSPPAPPCGDGPPANGAPRILSIASICILLQLSLMYVFSGLYKLNDTWAAGDAMRRALSFDLYVKPLGEGMLASDGLLHATSVAMPWVEIILPLLCFVPIFTLWLRSLAIIAFIGLHVMIELTMTTGLFPWVCMASWLLFVPTRRHLAPRDGHDSTIATGDPSSATPPEPRREGRGPGDARPSARTLPSGAQAAPHAVRRFLLQLPIAALFLFVLLWNISNYQEHRQTVRLLGDDWAWLAECTGMDQIWEMFREPPVDTGWYVVIGTLSNGKDVNLLTGEPVTRQDMASTDRPPRIFAMYPDHRWRKYAATISADSHKGYRTAFATALAMRWNARHGEDEQVDFIQLDFVREHTPIGDDTPAPPQRVTFLKIPIIRAGEIHIGPDRRWRTGWE